MRAPLHRRTEKIGACLADPFANGEGRGEIDTFTIPKRVQAAGVSNPKPNLSTVEAYVKRRDYRCFQEQEQMF
jgi:hypothetical protein